MSDEFSLLLKEEEEEEEDEDEDEEDDEDKDEEEEEEEGQIVSLGDSRVRDNNIILPEELKGAARAA